MTLDEMTAMMQRILAFRTNLEAPIAAELREAQRQLQRGRTLPYWLLEEDASLNFVAGTQYVPLPEDFLREADDGTPRYVPSSMPDSAFFLEKSDFNNAYQTFRVGERGYGKMYVVRRSTFWVFPIPIEDYTVTWTYYASEAFLQAGNDENEWSKRVPNLLMGIAGLKLARDTREGAGDAVTRFAEMRSEGWRELLGDTLDREIVNRDYHMGENL